MVKIMNKKYKYDQLVLLEIIKDYVDFMLLNTDIKDRFEVIFPLNKELFEDVYLFLNDDLSVPIDLQYFRFYGAKITKF